MFLKGRPIFWLSISSNCSLQPGGKHPGVGVKMRAGIGLKGKGGTQQRKGGEGEEVKVKEESEQSSLGRREQTEHWERRERCGQRWRDCGK